jgi:general L-amino acid transport system substrate-binding protein
MKKSVFLGAVAATGLVAGVASAGTLDDVKARDQLICGVNISLTGFGAPDANGNYQGFDVALCKALGAAILGDANKVKYVGTSGETRFTALASGEVDVLIRNSTWTFSRDTDLKFDFVAVNYYDGQGFMVKKELGVSSAKELDGATICIQTGTTTELNLADFFKANNMTYNPVTVLDDAEGQRQYVAGACDAYTTDASGLASMATTTGATSSAGPSTRWSRPRNTASLRPMSRKRHQAPRTRKSSGFWASRVTWAR